MPGVPAFILRRLYVKGSLHNTPSGWGFTLRNSLGSGYARGMQPLRVDDTEIPMAASSFHQEGQDITFDRVTAQNTFGLNMNRSIDISVAGAPLPSGTHKVWMGFIVPGFGKIGFDFTDEVAGA
jgi:hydroxymethylglutaryl-CoA reductase (NADPH)